MVVKIGDIYECDVRNGHAWRQERRKVLDVTDQCVFYQNLYDPPEGTHVERDEIADQHQASIKEWKTWVKLARKITVKDIAIELQKTMQCNCDLDKWEPEKSTGHSWVCRIHKSAQAIVR